MIKKNVVLYLVIVSAAFLLSTCATPRSLVLDPDLPRERTAKAIISRDIQVQRFNGIDVRRDWYPSDILRQLTVTIPSGPSEILFNIRTTNFMSDNIQLNFNFEAGNEYYIFLNHENVSLLRIRVGVGIWSNSRDRGNRDAALRYWELGEILRNF
jgi:hypothetical protein